MGTGSERTVRDLARRRGLRLMKARRTEDGYYVVNAFINAIVSGPGPISLEEAREITEGYVLLSEWERTPVGGTLSGKSAR